MDSSKELVLKDIGVKIRQMRNAKHLSLMNMAYLLDMEYNNLIRIEKGRTNLTIGTLLRICKVLDVDLSAVVNVNINRHRNLIYD
jgi:transcriptional regulator with XRE-family HTH domain